MKIYPTVLIIETLCTYCAHDKHFVHNINQMELYFQTYDI